LQNFPYEVRDKASLFVPSIGKVTIVVLLRNLLVSLASYTITDLHCNISLTSLQRLIQNKRMDDVKPAEATERPGTLEASS